MRYIFIEGAPKEREDAVYLHPAYYRESEGIPHDITSAGIQVGFESIATHLISKGLAEQQVYAVNPDGSPVGNVEDNTGSLSPTVVENSPEEIKGEGGQSTDNNPPAADDAQPETIEELREQYEKVIGKKAHGSMKIDTLKQAIAESGNQ